MNTTSSTTHADPDEKFSSFYTEVPKAPHLYLPFPITLGMFTGKGNRKTGLCPNSQTTNRTVAQAWSNVPKPKPF